jgi:hypothetical protein
LNSPAHLRFFHAAVLLLLACVSMLASAQGAGVVMAVSGQVTAVDAQGRERRLEKGAEIQPGERIVTADGALAQLRMADGGYLSVRSGTEMTLDKFVHDHQNQKNSSFLVSLVKGGFRSITGLIGRSNPDAYQIRTPTATIGVRGTDHEPMFIPPGVPNLASLGVPGVYDKVNQGETFIRNELGVLSLKPGQVGFAPIKPDTAPRALPKVPDFYKTELKVELSSARGRDDDAAPQIEKAPVSADVKLRPSLGNRTAAGAKAGALTPLDRSAVIGTVKTLDGATAIRTLDSTTTLKTLDSSTTSIKTLEPLTTTTISPTLSTTTTISPTLSTTTTSTLLTSPTLTTTISPTTTTISPTLSTTSTLLTSPTLTTTIAPTTTTTTTTSTLISPTTSTTLSSPLLIKKY